MKDSFGKITLLSYLAVFYLFAKGVFICFRNIFRREKGAWGDWLSLVGQMFLSVFVGMGIPGMVFMMIDTAIVSKFPTPFAYIVSSLFVYAIGVCGAVVLNRWHIRREATSAEAQGD